jgi:hypothetical protein
MLRARFHCLDSVWQAAIHEHQQNAPFSTLDLSHIQESERHSAIENVANATQQSLDIESGPLWKVVRIKETHKREDRLLWVIHHLAVDGISWRVLLEDLEMALKQLSQGQEICLPLKTSSLPLWSERLNQYVSSPAMLAVVWLPLLAAAVSLMLCAAFWLSRSNMHGQAVMQLNAHAFNLRHAMVITLTISLVLLVSVWLRDWLGEAGAIASAVLAGAAEIHAAAISLAHMSMQADSNMLHLKWGLCGVLASSVLAKSVVAWVSGGRLFCQRVGGALLLMLLSFALVLAWQTGFM